MGTKSNLKFNLMTILLLASLIVNGIFYSKKNNNSIPTKVCQDIPNYKLSPAEAGTYLLNYQKYLRSDIIVTNPDVRYFQLPRCELAQMIKDVGPNSDVRAHLAVKEIEINNIQTHEIVLVFQDHLPENVETSWFDFTTPCPNVCNN